MSTAQQQKANKENAQHSSGPVSPEGKLKSSLNATVHGFTGRKLFLTSDEAEPYRKFVASLTAEFRPNTVQSGEFLQHYIDLRWSLNQILIQQTNLLSIIDQITNQFLASGDLAGLEAALAVPYQRLRTLGTYEQRRRRAAKESLENFQRIEQEHSASLERAASAHEAMKTLKQNWNPAEFGFVHSLAEIEVCVNRKENAAILNLLKEQASSSARPSGQSAAAPKTR
jgi:hypothetical protein